MPTLTSEHCAFIVHGRAYGRYGMLVQTDWDYPSTAELFGWSLRRVQKRGRRTVTLQAVRKGKRNCDHASTDGTVACQKCGITASEFISAAGAYLAERAS